MSKKAAFLFIGGLILAIIVVSVVSMIFWGPKKEHAYIYVTTDGFGEDRDVTDKLLTVDPGDTLVDVMSLKYKQYYEAFDKPLVRQNEFVEFLGRKKENNMKIRVYIDDVQTLDISQAYLGTGSKIKFVYTK